MEKDADSLKQPMVSYLEILSEAVNANLDDPEELRRISNAIVQDKNDLYYVNERITQIINMSVIKKLMTDTLKDSIDKRK